MHLVVRQEAKGILTFTLSRCGRLNGAQKVRARKTGKQIWNVNVIVHIDKDCRLALRIKVKILWRHSEIFRPMVRAITISSFAHVGQRLLHKIRFQTEVVGN